MDIDFDEEDEWLEELIEKENDMDSFYETNVSSVQLYFLYINKNKEILHIKKTDYPIKNAVILKTDIIDLIKKNESLIDNTFSLTSLLQYNFSLDTHNLNNFISSPNKYLFLKKMNSIYDIHWKKTIEHFVSLNSLYFIFKKKQKSIDKTKKVYISKRRNKRNKQNKQNKQNKRKENRKNKTAKKKYNDPLTIKETDIIKLK